MYGLFFFPTSVGTCLGPLMHLVQSWSVLVSLSVGSGRPLGPFERPPERSVSQSVSQSLLFLFRTYTWTASHDVVLVSRLAHLDVCRGVFSLGHGFLSPMYETAKEPLRLESETKIAKSRDTRLQCDVLL